MSSAASRSLGDILCSFSSTARTRHSAKYDGKSSFKSGERRGACAATVNSGRFTATTCEYCSGKGSSRKCRNACRTTSAGISFAPLRRSEEHTSELQSHVNLVCRLLLEKKKK